MTETYPALPDWVQAVEHVGGKQLGFESIVGEEVGSYNLVTGYNFLSGIEVPAGKMWKITQVSIYYKGTVTNVRLVAYLISLFGDIALIDEWYITSKRWYMWSGELYIQEGEYLWVDIWNATAGDDAFLEYSGIQMNVL